VSAAAAPSAAPDYVSPLLGWRAWDVAEGIDEAVLHSVVHRATWHRGQAIEATCMRWRLFGRRRGPAPRLHCTCGIYATRTPADALMYLWELGCSPAQSTRVVGRVWLWGAVVECENGWRAQRAYPAELYVPAWAGEDEDPARARGRRLSGYGVPIRLVRCADAATLARLLQGHELEGAPAPEERPV
jgi:hypothetical protein